MGSWFSKWTAPKPVSHTEYIGNAKIITDPHILKQYEDQIYGIELTVSALKSKSIRQ
jgi:hypothetical protein